MLELDLDLVLVDGILEELHILDHRLIHLAQPMQQQQQFGQPYL
jgi:hypothetical protein